MANKTTRRKRKKNNKIKLKNKKIISILVITLIVIMIVVLSFIISGKNDDYIVCSKQTEYNNGIKQDVKLKYYFKKEAATKVDVEKVIYIDKNVDKAEYSYPNVIKQSIDNIYKEVKNYESSVNNDSIKIKMTYDDENFHILDDLIITIQDKNVSVNVLTQDNYNSYASIDLSKQVLRKEIIKKLSDKQFKCK